MKLSHRLKAKKGLLEQEVFVSLIHTAHELSSNMQVLLKQEDLSDALYNVLRILRGSGADGLPCCEISARMVKRDPDITRLVDRLVRRKLVRRDRNAEDRRVVQVSISKSGLDLLARLDEPIEAMHKEQLSHVTKKQQRELLKLLEIVRNE